MACCSQSIFAGNSAMSSIQYTAAMRAIHGDIPEVSVYYMDGDGNYVAAGIFTQKQFDGNTIFVDHGGTVRWLVKVR